MKAIIKLQDFIEELLEKCKYEETVYDETILNKLMQIVMSPHVNKSGTQAIH